MQRIADHKPLRLKLSVNLVIPAILLYKRSVDLNFDITIPKVVVTRFKGTYDYAKITEYLTTRRDLIEFSVEDLVGSGDIEGALQFLDDHLKRAHRVPGTRLQISKPCNTLNSMVKVNESFTEYRRVAGDSSRSDTDRENALNSYLRERKAVHYEVLKKEADAWSSVIAENGKSLWATIDWKGNYTREKPTKHPSVNEFQSFFENLYTSKDSNELSNIANLQSNVSIPVLDDPISDRDVDEAVKSMKNGGFDYNLQILLILTSRFSHAVLLLLNFIFQVRYPVHLALSLLSIIPKKGNMQLPKNYRGIQMLRALGSLYDRIIAKRLYRWMHVEAEQSAFQKGKSALLQIFILRILIEIAKRKNITLYIASVDLEKAFDKVSRYRLLAKLVARGIGCVMLEALKRIYLHTSCIIHFYGCFSSEFETLSGIRQGSASSVLLFILFMDGLFPFLRRNCRSELLIKDFHALVHADDTVIISTQLDKFITKCNYMMDYFVENSLSLNFDKSSYFIINPAKTDHKISLKLKGGYLKYKPIQKYLGVFVSDRGSIKHDISLFIKEKRSNVLVKFVNFCSKNFLAPLHVKLRVLDTCVSSSLMYAAETWADLNDEVELVYRIGLRTALGVRTNVNNEITYVESNRYPLKCRISRQQLKFWLSVKDYVNENPHSALKHLLDIAFEIKLPYITYYQELERLHKSPNKCSEYYERTFTEKWKANFENAVLDTDSRLGTYLQINPELSSPSYLTQTLFETDRLLLTRFRCGSHSLMIEKGRYTNLPRCERLCSCGTGTQSVLHCFSVCPLTLPFLQKSYTSLREVFEDEDICDSLHKVCKILKLPI